MKNGSELLAPHPLSTNTDKQGKVKKWMFFKKRKPYQWWIQN